MYFVIESFTLWWNLPVPEQESNNSCRWQMFISSLVSSILNFVVCEVLRCEIKDFFSLARKLVANDAKHQSTIRNTCAHRDESNLESSSWHQSSKSIFDGFFMSEILCASMHYRISIQSSILRTIPIRGPDLLVGS